MAIRVALVEDNDDLRKLTSSVLNFYQDLECVGAYESAEAFRASVGALQPDMVLMDIGLPGQDSIARYPLPSTPNTASGLHPTSGNFR